MVDMTPHPAAADQSRTGVGPWGVVIIPMIFYALAQFDKRLITVLIEPICETIGATDVQMSILSGTAFVSFYNLFSLPIGSAADRFSRRNIIFGGVVSWSIFSALGGLAHNFALLLFSRFGVGASEASLMPSAHSIVADIFSREKLARTLGVFPLGAFIGAAMSLAIGGLLIAHFGKQAVIHVPLIGALLPWQAVLLVASASGIPLAFLLFLVKEPAQLHRPAAASGSARGAMANLLRNRRFYLLHFIGFSTLAIMTAGFSSWVSTHMLRTFHEPIGWVGVIMAILQLTVGPPGMLLTVRAVDRMFRSGREDIHMMFYVQGVLVLSLAARRWPRAQCAAGLCWRRVVRYAAWRFPAGRRGSAAAGDPLHYRGKATAIFFICYNIIGQAFGPIAIALSTDLLLGDESRIGVSIALVGAIAGPLSALLLYSSRHSLQTLLRGQGAEPPHQLKRATMRRSIFLLLGAAAATLWTVPTPAKAAPADGCADESGLSFICGVSNPEDMVKIPGTPWVIASSAAGPKVKGERLYLIHIPTRRVEAIDAGTLDAAPDPLYGACPGALTPGTFSGHGLAVGEGPLRLYAINHGAREGVEIFDIVPNGDAAPRLRWAGCVLSPPNAQLNGVVALPAGGIAATKFHDGRDSVMRWMTDALAGVATGEVLEWQPGTGWGIIPDSATSGANGLAVSRGGKALYVGAWGSRRVVRLSRGRDRTLRESVDVGMNVDNLRWDDRGRLLATGQLAVGRQQAVLSCLGGATGICRVPFRVVRIDPRTLKVEAILAEADDEHFTLGSVAVDVGHEWWLGAIRGDRIARLSKSGQQPVRISRGK